MERRKAPKFQTSVTPGYKKDNQTYISVFPVQASQAYLNENTYFQNNQATQKIDIANDQLVQNVSKILQDEKVQKNEINKYFISITTNPVTNNNSSGGFVQRYQLQEKDLVPVCENKMFTLKSYYNYLQDEEIEKALKKIEERNRNLEQVIKKQRDSLFKNQAQFAGQAWGNVEKSRQEQQILDPIHIRFAERVKNFNPKEKQRVQISQRLQQNHRSGW